MNARRSSRSRLDSSTASIAGCPRERSSWFDDIAKVAKKVCASHLSRIGLASYSLWQFQHDDLRDLEKNIDLAAEWGFAGVEILHHQLQREDNGYFQKLKQRAALHGLDLYGMASHQTFLTPDENKRRQQIELTMLYLEQCYQLGIPTMRVQTGTWGTSKDFDDLMAHRGIEPTLPGHTDEEAFKWTIDAFEQIVPIAEKCGVTMGLENHWGLGRTPHGR